MHVYSGIILNHQEEQHCDTYDNTENMLHNKNATHDIIPHMKYIARENPKTESAFMVAAG